MLSNLINFIKIMLKKSKLATCSADKTIKLWNITNKGCTLDRTLYGHSKWVKLWEKYFKKIFFKLFK